MKNKGTQSKFKEIPKYLVYNIMLKSYDSKNKLSSFINSILQIKNAENKSVCDVAKDSVIEFIDDIKSMYKIV